MDEMPVHRTGWECPEPTCPFVCNMDSDGAIEAHKRQHARGKSLADIAGDILDEIDAEKH